MLSLFEIFINIVECFIAVMFLSLYFGSKYDGIKSCVSFVLYWIVRTLYLCFLNIVFPAEGFLVELFIVMDFFYAAIFLNGNIITKAFIAGFQRIVQETVSVFVLILSYYITKLDYMQFVDVQTTTVVRGIMMSMTQLLVASVLVVPLKFQIHLIGKTKLLGILSVISPLVLSAATSSIISIYIDTPENGVYLLLANSSLVIADICIYGFCYATEHYLNNEVEMQMIKIKHDSYIRQIKETEDMYNKVCGIRHDLKNHFATIDTLIDEEPQKAHEYIKSLTQNQLQSIIRFVKTDNDSFNAIANAKIAVCEREGIKVQTRIKNNSLSRLADDEIGIIFGNLFDNAIEAARQAEDKQINLDVTVKGEYLSIIMTNSVQGSVLADNKSLETTKKNKSLHGYGTKNINRIVKKYDGVINYFEENGLFGCQILI